MEVRFQTSNRDSQSFGRLSNAHTLNMTQPQSRAVCCRQGPHLSFEKLKLLFSRIHFLRIGLGIADTLSQG